MLSFQEKTFREGITVACVTDIFFSRQKVLDVRGLLVNQTV